MSLTIDDLFQSSCYRRRTCHAAPTRSDHPGVGAFCATVFAPGLAPCPTLAPGGDSGPWDTHGHGRLEGHGACHGAPFHERPSGLEPGYMVRAPGRPDSVRAPR